MKYLMIVTLLALAGCISIGGCSKQPRPDTIFKEGPGKIKCFATELRYMTMAESIKQSGGEPSRNWNYGGTLVPSEAYVYIKGSCPEDIKLLPDGDIYITWQPIMSRTYEKYGRWRP